MRERKGWHFLENDAIYNGNPDDSEQAIEDLERLRRRGATHFVFTKNTFWWLQSYPEFVGHLPKRDPDRGDAANLGFTSCTVR